MSNHEIVQAWKNPVYRNSLTQAERDALPPNPAGTIEIFDEDLDKIAGGLPGTNIYSIFCRPPDTGLGTCNIFCNSALHNC